MISYCFMRITFVFLFLECTYANYQAQQGASLSNGGGFLPDGPLVESINGTVNFRIHRRRGKDEKTWFEGWEMKHLYCGRQSKCERLKETKCLGARLPYNFTSLDLSDSYSQEYTLDRLQSYQALKYVPKCWAVIQPFLCSVFLPKCETIRGQDYVYLPSLEMCRMTVEPCRALYNTSYFPDFLKCNESVYPSKCNNDVREIKYNVTGQCLKPLIPADTSANYFGNIDGCGLECKDPLYTDDEHKQIHKFIAYGASICLVANLFAIVTFIIDWKNVKYPALTIFYMNISYMMTCFGWLAQFTLSGWEEIVCRKDGTLRHSEPSTGENLSCIVVFVLIYYFLIASMVWFVIYLYGWHMTFKAIGQIHENIDKKSSYFHLIAWSLPLVLTITIMALSEVDGNSVVGICFVGYVNHHMRALLIGPILAVLIIGVYFVSGGMLVLVKLKLESTEEIISARAGKKIREFIVRMGLCMLFTMIIILATIACHIYEFRNSGEWIASLRNFIMCKITTSHHEDYLRNCKMESRPSVAILQIHLLCLFAAGLMMSSWVWTCPTVKIWKRYLNRKLGHEVDEPMRVQKHKVIAQTFAKKKVLDEEGRCSISFRNTHTDPVGLNFNLNSGSQDFSTTWARYLPHFVNRRGAYFESVTSSSHEPRRSSRDSEISFHVRHVSVESRRNSEDSQVAVKIAEMKTKVASRSRGKKSKKMRKQEYAATKTSKGYKTKRRSASAGLNSNDFSSLLSNERVLLPVLHNQKIPYDEENASTASFHMKDSQIDMILKAVGGQDNTSDDESNDFTMHDNSANMKEYNTSDDEQMAVKHNDEDDLCDIQGSIRGDRKKDGKTYSFSSPDSETSTSYMRGNSNSRNSKRSCDVGIQANAHEITTQLNLAESGDKENPTNGKKWPMEKDSVLSQTDKLKLLLLPSK
ncbi:protein smoothened [Phlebotomus argentipes]|uniref:protein smoothened n=1 Tax=Phlebotomus argentipes TaxID=94469 RepID=UPI0028935267|nr:protein smoothened [Phlebotomus argentipes]